MAAPSHIKSGAISLRRGEDLMELTQCKMATLILYKNRYGIA